ncbi:MAG: AAA family ATPase [Burkholderiaceae bacterium]|nr:MAG: AAA family ATPase [Burkholderiaceae bacterium]
MPHTHALTTTPPIAIPIAGFKSVYDTAKVEHALQELSASAHEGLRGTYEKMLKNGGARLCVKPSHMPDMQALYRELPNFSEVLDDIRKQLALCMETSDPLELAPMLLLGEPGIGKTHFAKRLSQILGTAYGFVSMSSLTAGWVLSGSSSQWKNSKTGKVFDTLVHGSYANPVMVVDEIDKAAVDGQYDPLGALYSLLEPDTAEEFIDEFAEIPINARDIVWIATANQGQTIPEPILNRMNVYQIDAPNLAAARNIALSIYQDIRGAHVWGERFPIQPADATLDVLARCRPREMRRLILHGFGNARLHNRDRILPEDIEMERSMKRARIGF